LNNKQAGFTIVELLIVIIITVLVATIFFQFASVSIGQYIRLQTDASRNANMASQSQRIAKVVRGATSITSAGAYDMQLYSYFYPSDTYVSQTRYYLDATKMVLKVDVTPMSANPPQGSPLAGQTRTYTIIPQYYYSSTTSLFNYLDASGNTLTQPINDLNAIKMVKINLAAKDTRNTTQSLSLQVNLRNKKTNL
jgi:type II secretory pathway pseudopilin PulG